VARRDATGEIAYPEHGRMQGIETRGDVLVDASIKVTPFGHEYRWRVCTALGSTNCSNRSLLARNNPGVLARNDPHRDCCGTATGDGRVVVRKKRPCRPISSSG
jgi:hypothetical protein